MSKIPNGVERAKTDWGTHYRYKGVEISRGAGRFSARYDFRVNGERIMANNLGEAVKRIDAVIG